MSTIIIVEARPLIRQSMVALLGEYYKNCSLIGVDDIDEFYTSVSLNRSDVIFLMINQISIESELSVVKKIKLQYPGASLVTYDQGTGFNMAFSYLKSGVHGYLTSDNDMEDLIKCVKIVSEGDHFVDPRHLDTVVDSLIKQNKLKRRVSQKHMTLTSRQHEVAVLLGQGMNASHIAEKLGLKISTISTVKTTIFTKLGIDNILKLKEMLEG